MKVGICLYSIKQSLGKDPLGTIKRVAELGFKYMETPAATHMKHDLSPSPVTNFGLNIAAEEVKKFVDAHGIKITGNHYYPLDYPNYDRYLEYQAALNLDYVGPSAEFYDDYNDVLRKMPKNK